MTTGSSTEIMVRPENLTDAAAALARSSGRVLIRGAGTASAWAGPAHPPGLVLDTTGLTGIIAHNPADMTVSVRAGTALRELNATLAEHGQHVAFDAARVRRGATVGGLVATADSGPSALLSGSMRDLVIGATIVLVDGTVARSGGHVIKNVAGYDLTKLLHGSYGAFALLAELVVRLHPIPAASATVRCECSLAEAADATADVLCGPTEPAALEWCAGALLLRLDGTSSAALEQRVARLIEVLAEHGPTRRLSERDSASGWDDHATLVDDPPGDTALLRLGCRPSRLPDVLGQLGDTLGALRFTAGLATGIGTATLPAESALIARAHEAVASVGGSSVLRYRPSGAAAPSWGPAPSALAVLRAIKADLDPEGRLGAGRFAPWF